MSIKDDLSRSLLSYSIKDWRSNLKKIGIFSLIITSLLVTVFVSYSKGQMAVLQPGRNHGLKRQSQTDTISWRRLTDPTLNTGFLNFEDSLAMWFKPLAPCSLIAIRFYSYNWEGSTLFHVWDGSQYDGHITTTDSTDSNGWIGNFQGGEWVPGPVLGHSPIGGSAYDENHNLWGPFPYTITKQHSEQWIEIPIRYGIQGEIDLGEKPFFITTTFYINNGWGMAAEHEGATPFHFFKYYNLPEDSPDSSPDGEHVGWFLHSTSAWIEAVVKYYEPIPAHIDFSSLEIDDDNEGQSSGNGNGVIEPGEHIELFVTLQNEGDTTASDISASMRSDDSNITLIRNDSDYGEISPKESRSNIDPFVIDVFQQHPTNTHVYIYLDISSSSGVTWSLSFSLFVIDLDADILLMLGQAVNDIQLYTNLMDVVGISYNTWSVKEIGNIPENVLSNYHTVIWSVGRSYSNPLSHGDKQILMTFLSQGGNLFLNGRGFYYEEEDDQFFLDYIHARNFRSYDREYVLRGIDENPVVGNIEITLNESRLFGEVEPIPPAFPIFTFDTTTAEKYVASAFETDSFKVVYFSFPFEDIAAPDDQWTVMERIFNWFEHKTSIEQNTVTAIPSTFQLFQNYPNPFNTETDIRYQIVDDRFPSPISLKIYNILGQEVKTLVNREHMPREYVATWDGKDRSGNDVSSGIYFYRLSTGKNISQARRMMLLR